MAERKAVNKYYPPEWDPSKGSINKFVGQHPLRERARKLDQGILIVRFEMPFNIWCGKCKQHIGKGVRFNAEKKQIGKYFSTKIWSFRMKCHLCGNWMEIQTDPKNSDYIVVSGAQKKNETWISGPEDGTIELLNEEESQKLATDPFYKLEYSNLDKKKAEDTIPIIQELVKLKDNLKDDYSLSSLLRKNFREKKKRN
jgi:coiled-coil domain-containing protein 130